MASSARNLRLILDAVERGALSPRRAVTWARRAASGEDIAIVAELASSSGKRTRVDASGRTFTEPVPVAGAGVLTTLADQLAGILAGGGPAMSAPAPGEMTDEEADRLYPPRSAAEAEARHQRLEAAAGRIMDFSEDEIFAMLFPYPGEEDVR
jgi:hypothetical protein